MGEHAVFEGRMATVCRDEISGGLLRGSLKSLQHAGPVLGPVGHFAEEAAAAPRNSLPLHLAQQCGPQGGRLHLRRSRLSHSCATTVGQLAFQLLQPLHLSAQAPAFAESFA